MFDPESDKYAEVGKLNLEIEENKYIVNLFGNKQNKADAEKIISNLIQKETKKI